MRSNPHPSTTISLERGQKRSSSTSRIANLLPVHDCLNAGDIKSIVITAPLFSNKVCRPRMPMRGRGGAAGARPCSCLFSDQFRQALSSRGMLRWQSRGPSSPAAPTRAPRLPSLRVRTSLAALPRAPHVLQRTCPLATARGKRKISANVTPPPVAAGTVRSPRHHWAGLTSGDQEPGASPSCSSSDRQLVPERRKS